MSSPPVWRAAPEAQNHATPCEWMRADDTIGEVKQTLEFPAKIVSCAAHSGITAGRTVSSSERPRERHFDVRPEPPGLKSDWRIRPLDNPDVCAYAIVLASIGM